MRIVTIGEGRHRSSFADMGFGHLTLETTQYRQTCADCREDIAAGSVAAQFVDIDQVDEPIFWRHLACSARTEPEDTRRAARAFFGEGRIPDDVARILRESVGPARPASDPSALVIPPHADLVREVAEFLDSGQPARPSTDPQRVRDEIARLESAIARPVPDLLQLLWPQIDGRDAELVPGFRMLPVADVRSEWTTNCDAMGRTGHWNADWLPIAGNGAGDFIVVDLSPRTHAPQRVILFFHDESRRPVLGRSLAHWLLTCVHGVSEDRNAAPVSRSFFDTLQHEGLLALAASASPPEITEIRTRVDEIADSSTPTDERRQKILEHLLNAPQIEEVFATDAHLFNLLDLW